MYMCMYTHILIQESSHPTPPTAAPALAFSPSTAWMTIGTRLHQKAKHVQTPTFNCIVQCIPIGLSVTTSSLLAPSTRKRATSTWPKSEQPQGGHCELPRARVPSIVFRPVHLPLHLPPARAAWPQHVLALLHGAKVHGHIYLCWDFADTSATVQD